VRQVNDLLAGYICNEVLIAAREADDLMGIDRVHHEGHVVLDHGPVQPHVDRLVEAALGELGDPVGADGSALADDHELVAAATPVVKELLPIPLSVRGSRGHHHHKEER
jgi:hypothetical protein